MTRLSSAVPAYSAVYHFNAAEYRAEQRRYVEVSDAAVALFGSLFFAVAGALTGAALHI